MNFGTKKRDKILDKLETNLTVRFYTRLYIYIYHGFGFRAFFSCPIAFFSPQNINERDRSRKKNGYVYSENSGAAAAMYKFRRRT